MGGLAKVPRPTMMKPGTVIPSKEDHPKNINHITLPLSSADISVFSPEINNFCYVKKCRYRLHFDRSFLIRLTFSESLKVVLISMVATLMVTAN